MKQFMSSVYAVGIRPVLHKPSVGALHYQYCTITKAPKKSVKGKCMICYKKHSLHNN